MKARVKGIIANALLAIAVFTCAGNVCIGAEYCFQSGRSDFSDPASYRFQDGSIPTACPGPQDEILLPAGTEIAISAPSASFDTFANCQRVKPQPGTIVKITVTDGKATLNAAVNNHVVGNGDYDTGELVKLGAGELWLNSNDGCPKDGSDYYDYYIGLTVEAGILRMPQNCGAANAFYGKVTVGAGAVLYITASTTANNGAMTRMRQLLGAGEIRNEPGVSGSTRSGNSMSLEGTPGSEDSLFDGKISSPVTIYNSGCGNITLTNPESNYKEVFLDGGNNLYPQPSACSVMRVTSLATPGPLGNGTVHFIGNGGILSYIGEDEDVAIRAFSFDGTGSAPVFDAGSFGGLDFTGDWSLGMGEGFVRSVVLCGSNTSSAAVLNNAFVRSSSSTSSKFRLVKRGSGIWKIGDGNANRRSALGEIAIEEGTLQFAALGADVEAVELGGVGAAPALEYAGASDAVCAASAIKLVAEGGTIRNPTGNGFTIAGVVARDDNASPTLTLDGSDDNESNIAKDISDGATGARVGVVKMGTGLWKIGGNLTFSGDLHVADGKLAVESPQGAPDPAPYKWFRLSFAEIGENKNILAIREICLFDKDGNRQNQGLEFLMADGVGEKELHDVYIPENIGPGQAGYDKGAAGLKLISTYAAEFGACFVGKFSGSTAIAEIQWKNASGDSLAPTPSARETWIPIVMHLKDDANPVTHFDIQGYSNQNGRGGWPTHFMLEASLDGEDWDVVYSNIEGDRYDYSETGGPGWGDDENNVWLSDGKPAHMTGTATYHKRTLSDGSWTASVSEGVPHTNFTWYRLSIAQIGANKNYILGLREICLFDKDGVRQNVGLTQELGASPSAEVHDVFIPAALAPGQVGYDTAAAGHRVKATYGTEFEPCFGNSFGGDSARMEIVWMNADGSMSSPDPNDRTTWIPIVMHLKEGANPVTHFDIQGLSNAGAREIWPTRLLLEGSRDGKIWYVVFDNATRGEAFDMSNVGGSGWSNPECNVWLSDGADACTAGTDTYHGRKLGDGWQTELSGIPYEGPYDQFAHVRSVRVDGGAMLTASHVLPIKALTVDASQKAFGTIEGFDFSAGIGFVDVLGTVDWSNPRLPIDLVDCTGVENIANWAVYANGKLKSGRKIVVKDGQLFVVKSGLALIVR